ncbi:MAG: ribulose 1,5-bisphosphate carboxylase [Elusimicrobia bacterium]|nr:ribulose 1,5-bisphosphate carboxylase [Elusimicrobiota bacterium]
MADAVVAEYLLARPPSEAARAARLLAVEQTVEVPESLIPPDIEARVVGKVLSVEPAGEGASRARVSYDAALSGWELPRLLNLLYGNVSLQSGIRLEGVELPASFLGRFKGPNFGGAGLRRLTGVAGRPLLATALKPNGAPVEEFARLASDFVRAGGDVVKDDQNLCDADRAAFETRVRRVQDAVSEANAKTGRGALYCPILCGPADDLEARVEVVQRCGAKGVLAPPLLLGLDAVRWLAEDFGLVVLAHPSFTGTFFSDPRHGVSPGVLLGTLFRLAGCDASIFPNPGGRFGFSKAACLDLAERLRGPLGTLAPALPAPAGGMTFESLPGMADDYGPESMFLIGGGLLAHSPSVYDGTKAFLDALRERFAERLSAPELVS